MATWPRAGESSSGEKHAAERRLACDDLEEAGADGARDDRLRALPLPVSVNCRNR